MVMVAVLVMWNLTPVGPVVSEEMMFENVDRRQQQAYSYYKLTSELKAEVS